MKSQEDLLQIHGTDYVEYFEKSHSPMRLERLFEHMSLNTEQLVVDFGCGSGLLLPYVSSMVEYYCGVDFSEPFIEAANRLKKHLGVENAEFVCSSIEKFCLNNQDRFDVGFALDLSEHVYDQEWMNILKHIRVTLKRGGTLYLHTPNAIFFVETMKRRGFILKQFPQHVAVRTAEANAALLEQAGLTVTRVVFLPHYNALKYIHPLSHIPLIGKYLRARLFIEAKK